MRKFTVALAVALTCLACFATGASARAVATTVTIESFPSGAFGLVKSGDLKTCAANRKVLVFEQQGQTPDPGSDPKVGADRAAETEPGRYQWSVDLKQSGNYYAQAEATKGCAAALSGDVQSLTVAALLGAEDASYPPCSPYISEGTSEICRFNEMYVELEQEGVFNPCRFGSSSGGCPGYSKNGPFPWGTSGAGGKPRAQFSWHQSGSVRVVEVASSSSYGARLDGNIPNSGSNRYTITNAFAQNDRGGNNGDNFFTPDLAGQAPGEVGGPLSLNFQNGSGTSFGAEAWIRGYLYLKH